MTTTKTPTGLDALQYVNGDIVPDVFHRHALNAVLDAVERVSDAIDDGSGAEDRFTKDVMVDAAVEAVIKFVASFSETFDPADEDVTLGERLREMLLRDVQERI